MPLTPEETRAITNFQLLTAKPMLIVVNVGEDQIGQVPAIEADLNSRYAKGNRRVMALCSKLEMELTQLDEAAAIQWLNDSVPVPGTPVIVEAPGEEWSEYGRVSMHTGLPALLGWKTHEVQWRGRWEKGQLVSREAEARVPDIDTIYKTLDQAAAQSLLQIVKSLCTLVANELQQTYLTSALRPSLACCTPREKKRLTYVDANMSTGGACCTL
jgi:uncharacterized membrane protein